MKVKVLEGVGAFFVVLGLSVTPDRGNTGANLLAIVAFVTLGAVCLWASEKILKGVKK